MAFWELERHPADAIALIEADASETGRIWPYAELARLADQSARALPSSGGDRTFGLLSMPNSAAAVALYLGALRSAHHVPLLLQPDTNPSLLQALADHYQPDWIALPANRPGPWGYRNVGTSAETDGALALWCLDTDDATAVTAPASELGLLLSTSGSTGSSKLVRLSYSAIRSNAESITDYLALRSDDRAITTLPLAYSFGMSILNSHLNAGASLVLTDQSLVGRDFWQIAQRHSITSLSGVPATYEMLRRVSLERFGLKNLRMLTQAGGRLREAMVEHFLQLSASLGLQFFVMYGQTEAAPRISFVPSARLGEKLGSIGVAVPGGRLEVDVDTGELIYYGPNVMLGYAENRGDLALGDEARGTLRTGDLARQDEDGYVYITGRLKRFVKISGSRVNLDEVEMMLSTELARPLACAGNDDDMVVFVPGSPAPDVIEIKQLIQLRYKLFPGHIRVLGIGTLPLLPAGKTDYHALRELDERRST